MRVPSYYISCFLIGYVIHLGLSKFDLDPFMHGLLLAILIITVVVVNYRIHFGKGKRV